MGSSNNKPVPPHAAPERRTSTTVGRPSVFQNDRPVDDSFKHSSGKMGSTSRVSSPSGNSPHAGAGPSPKPPVSPARPKLSASHPNSTPTSTSSKAASTPRPVPPPGTSAPVNPLQPSTPPPPSTPTPPSAPTVGGPNTAASSAAAMAAQIPEVASLLSSSGSSMSLSSQLGEEKGAGAPAANGGASPGGLALFINTPKECNFCGSSAVAYECRDCSDFYICENCRFDLAIIESHDPTHVIVSLQETHCNTSRTFGDSMLSLIDGTVTSCLFYNPCYLCKRGIDDNELVHRCERCDFIVCDDCFHARQPIKHEHQLKEFQRKTKNSSVQESFLVNKSRNSDGNKIINDYVVVRLLGQGSYAKVKLVQHIRTRELFALKILKRQKKKFGAPRIGGAASGPSGTSDDDLLREIAVMKFVEHPNIVQLKEVIDDIESFKVYIIMEYCEKGPVHVLGDPPLPMKKVREYGCAIMRGLLHMHSEFLYHRDVKPANCLVDGNDVVKIADFGTCNSRIKTKDSDGTPAFNCPEQINSTEVSGDVVDSWGFALTLFQIAFGKLPFKSLTYFDIRRTLTSPDPIEIPSDSGVDSQLRDLLRRMLEKDLEKRMLLEEAALHGFFSGDAEIRETVINRRRGSASMSSHPTLGSLPRLSVTVSETLYSKALESVHRGKNLTKSFHGIKAMRNLRRKEVKTAEKEDDVLQDSCTILDEFEDLNRRMRDEEAGAAAAGDDGDADSGLDASSGSESYSFLDAGESAIKRCDDAAVVVARERIKVMREKKRTGLDLSRVRMSVPPKDVCGVDELTSVKFAYNGLKSVSTINFAQFALLQEITIVSNLLERFPAEVLAAPRLVRLDLSNNLISDIPPTLRTKALFLERLNLHRNNFTAIGCDAEGKSLLAGRSLRHVRLSSNMMETLPARLETTSHLELVLDAHPALMDSWDEVVRASRPKPPPAVVIWDDYFPVLLSHPTHKVWIATGALSLYRVNTLQACKARHVVLFQQADQRFPTGRFDHNELTAYFQRLAATLAQRLRAETAGATNNLRAVAPLKSLPRVAGKASRAYVADYFFVSRSPEDEDGGYTKLHDYINDALDSNQPILFFMSGGNALQDTRENTIAALADSLSRQSDSPEELQKQFEVVMKAMHGMYA